MRVSLDAAIRELVVTVVREQLGDAADPWLSTAEVDALIGRRARRAAIDSGELPASRVGRRWLVRRSAIDRYLEGHRVRPTPAANQNDEPDGDHVGRIMRYAR